MSIRDKIVRWFGLGQQPATQEYAQISYGNFGNNYQKRPPFSTYWADLMAMDQQVWFGTAIGNAPLLSAEVEVTGPSAEVNEFVGRQWDKLWSTSADKILRAKQYGASGYEAVYHVVRGEVEFQGLLDRHPRDTVPLLHRGKQVAVRFNNVGQSSYRGTTGKIDLRAPRGLWITYCAEHGARWGRALYERAYAPWYEKAMDGGALDLRRLRMVKDAWVGDVVKFPFTGPLSKFVLPSGQEITARDMMREVFENRASGGAITLPSDCGQDGKPLFEYTPPSPLSGATQILEWIHDLDWDVLDGLLVPREVVEAATTGSGFSGRSIPFISFLGMRDLEFGSYVRQIDEQMLRWLVAARFGVRASKDYEIRPKPLMETVGKQMGPMGKPETNESSMGGEGRQGGQRPELRPATPGGPNRPPANGNAALQFSVGPHSYSSTQINLPEQLAEKVRKLAATIPRADLAADGREDEPHVTVKYGLHVNEPGRVAELLRGVGLVHITIGQATVFNCGDYDVVKLDVESEDLHRLNQRISDSIPCTDTHPEYLPHITLAYVKPGMGQKYAGETDLTGVSFSSDQVIFSNMDGDRSVVPLTVLAALQFAADTDSAIKPADRLTTKATAAGVAITAGLSSRIDRLLKKNGSDLENHASLLTSVDWLAELESLVRELSEPLAQSIYEASVSAWVGGASDQLDNLPPGAQLPVSVPPTPPPPTPPAPPSGLPSPEGEPPPIRLTATEKAVKRLQERAVVTPAEYADLTAAARQEAFTIAGDLTEATIGRVHELLAENLQRGASLKDFRAAVVDEFDSLPIGEAHLEQVYRNAINESFSQGMETVLEHPMVADAFPYRMYAAIRDGRVRHEHLALEHLGLNSTSIYFADDPTWGRFRPPWDYNCRCGWIPLSIEDAARHGVQHARDWLAAIARAKKSEIYDGNPYSVMPPRQWVQPPPFSPPPGWDRR